MVLKLFRSTGYSSILMAGETRQPMHPGWMILAISLWAGFLCNVALWRGFAGNGQAGGPVHAVLLAAFITGLSATLLSVFGWRKTLKPVATFVLVAAALTACTTWSEAAPFDGTLLDRGIFNMLLPSWASLFRWQTWAALAGLAVLPSVWVWNTGVRRLDGEHQLRVNIKGALSGAALLVASGWLL